MHADYELRDLGRACCIPVHRYSVGIATGYTDLSQIPQITKNTGISPNITACRSSTPFSDIMNVCAGYMNNFVPSFTLIYVTTNQCVSNHLLLSISFALAACGLASPWFHFCSIPKYTCCIHATWAFLIM